MHRQAIIAAFFGSAVATAGLMTLLYVWLTADRRRVMREIRMQAAARGWAFHLRQWMGNPAAFRIEGRTSAGNVLEIKTAAGGESAQGWSEKLTVNLPELAGRPDFAMFPRGGHDHDFANQVAALTPQFRAKLAKFSSTAVDAISMAEDSAEAPAGWPDFDRDYRVMMRKGKSGPVDSTLARALLEWHQGAVIPKESMAWRGPFGLHYEAHLPGPASWATVAHAVEIAQQLARRLPAAEPAPKPSGMIDGLLAKLQ